MRLSGRLVSRLCRACRLQHVENPAGQFRQPLSGGRGNLHDGAAQLLGKQFRGRIGIRQFRLADADNFGTRDERWVVQPHFLADLPVILDRVRLIRGCWLNQMNQNTRPLHMLEELVSQTSPGVRPPQSGLEYRPSRTGGRTRLAQGRGWDTWL